MSITPASFLFNKSLTCVELPPNIHSSGMWPKLDATAAEFEFKTTSATLPMLQKKMLMTFLATQLFHLILGSFGVPFFVSQMLAGFLLGPAVVGRIKFDKNWYNDWMLSLTSQDILGTLTMFGFSMFLFLAAVKMDASLLLKTGRKAFYTGVFSLIVPLIVGFSTVGLLEYQKAKINPKEKKRVASETIFLVLSICATSFPVIVSLLSQLRILTSELGRLGLSAALVCDMLNLILTTIARAFVSTPSARKFNYKSSLVILGYSLACAFVARPALNWVIRQTPKGKPVNNGYIFVILLLALASGAHKQFVLFGPFFFGLVIPSGPPLGSTLAQKYDFMVSRVFMPLFVTNCVIMADVRELRFDAHLLVLLVTMLAKFLGTLAPALCCRIPIRDALALAFILSCKGAVEIGGYFVIYDGQLITDGIYALAMLMILFAHFSVAYAVKHLYKTSTRYAGYQQRNVLGVRPNSELKILSCIYKQDNVPAVINLLDVACPTGDNPIGLNVLHLIEMTGQDAPMLISHRMQKKTMSSFSDSEDVLVSFLNLDREYGDAVEVHPYTAVWPSKWMYEEICTLALDRLTHLIILPFHRQWTVDGAVKSEDETVRNINISVLDGSPCSVGVLVNRGPLRQNHRTEASQSQFNVALIFLGGEDDREALALTGRMTADPNITLTVFHISPTTLPENGPNWENILDFESLRKFRQNNTGNGRYVIYTEAVSESGEQTVDMLREIVHKYDLFVVGRRKEVKDSPQTSGLEDWSEFPELGIVGDMLASDDLGCRSSILVVQNQ
ncbi:putative cation/H+ exchanger [Rosa chinensis]|uniref:Putative cation/H+ exchanger n=2 Tax=Rosa chinensis TaxID=74649 RepID=A0A2P6R4W9_ROSCH|nr:putative cation/H+ exchanger [Rosa chinensis]